MWPYTERKFLSSKELIILVNFSCHLEARVICKTWLRNCPDQNGLWACLWDILIALFDVGGTRPVWEAPFPGQVVLGFVRKQAKQQSSSMIFTSLLASPPWLPLMIDCDLEV